MTGRSALGVLTFSLVIVIVSPAAIPRERKRALRSLRASSEMPKLPSFGREHKRNSVLRPTLVKLRRELQTLRVTQGSLRAALYYFPAASRHMRSCTTLSC